MTKRTVTGALLLSCVLATPLSAGQATASHGQSSKQARAERRTIRFQGMDLNRDGVITRNEWRGSARAFERHDTNHDGVLSGAEVSPGEAAQDTSGDLGPADPENPLAQSFIRADQDRDGIISRDEWAGDLATFRRVDANGDGVITRREYLGEGWEAAGAVTSPNDPRRNTRAYQSGFDRGLADGRQAGKEDKELRNQWDLEGQRELEQADAGYETTMGARTEYQAGYRAGFRSGYRQGFGPRG